MVKTERIADAATAATITLFGLTLTDINQMVQIAAGVGAVITAIVSGLFYFRRWRNEAKRFAWEEENHNGHQRSDTDAQDG